MEKVRNYYSLEQAEKDTLFFKLRLQDIMATLKQEKQQYDYVQIQKINRYEKQIESKNFLILQLTHQLESSNQKLEQKNKENQNYKEIILQLKMEFFKMFEAVRNMGESETFAFEPQPTLIRVKSDLHKRKTKLSFPQQKQSLLTSPSKQMRIDINSYFLNLKQLKLIKQSKCSIDEKESNKTKNTDQERWSTRSQNFKETTCFKELLIKDIQNYSRYAENKACNNLQATESSSNLKSTWVKTYKQNWASTQ